MTGKNSRLIRIDSVGLLLDTASFAGAKFVASEQITPEEAGRQVYSEFDKHDCKEEPLQSRGRVKSEKKLQS